MEAVSIGWLQDLMSLQFASMMLAVCLVRAPCLANITISLGCDRLFLLFVYCFFDELNRQKLLCVNAKPCFTPDSWFVRLFIALCSHDGVFSSAVRSLGQSHGFELESSSASISSLFLLWWNCPGETSAIQLKSALKNQEHNKSNLIALWSVMIYRRTDE